MSITANYNHVTSSTKMKVEMYSTSCYLLKTVLNIYGKYKNRQKPVHRRHQSHHQNQCRRLCLSSDHRPVNPLPPEQCTH